MIELDSRRVDGSGTPAAIKLNGPVLTREGGQNGVDAGCTISPDSQWVVYAAEQETDTVDELFSTRLPTLSPEIRPAPTPNFP